MELLQGYMLSLAKHRPPLHQPRPCRRLCLARCLRGAPGPWGSGLATAGLHPGQHLVNSPHSVHPRDPRHPSSARFMVPSYDPMLTFFIRVPLFLLMLMVASVAAFLLRGSAGGPASSASMAVFTNIDARPVSPPAPRAAPAPTHPHTPGHATHRSEGDDCGIFIACQGIRAASRGHTTVPGEETKPPPAGATTRPLARSQRTAHEWLAPAPACPRPCPCPEDLRVQAGGRRAP